jgi:hypothetical protein
MVRRKFFSLVMVIIDVALLGLLACAGVEKGRSLEPEPDLKGSQGNRVVAYYFHLTIRCATCLRIESYSKHAIEAGFPQELRSGKLEWSSLDIQSPENRHFKNDFDLHSSSLVIVRFRDGKQVEWQNLNKVWELTGDLSDFKSYVQHEVRGYLDAR